nr:protein nuclear fusion defective 2 [Tanacetum cinerariifolium]
MIPRRQTYPGKLSSHVPIFLVVNFRYIPSKLPQTRSPGSSLRECKSYDCNFQNNAMTHSAYLKENKKASKDLNSTVSARSQSSPALHIIDLETYLNFYKSTPCDCYQISAQPRLSSSFSASLETLQKHLNYEFQNVILLRRAMTHSSYSLENNKEFSILGERLIETTVALRSLTEDIDISLGDLNDKISEVSDVDTSCGADGMRLGLQEMVRVSSSTDSSTSSIVCDAFRAMLWTIALDSGKCDDAHNVFWAVHGGDVCCTLNPPVLSSIPPEGVKVPGGT